MTCQALAIDPQHLFYTNSMNTRERGAIRCRPILFSGAPIMT